MKKESSFYKKSFDPLRLFLLLAGGQLALVLGAKLLQIMKVIESSERFPWMAGAAVVYIFAMFAALLLIPAKSIPKYIGRAVYSFMGLVLSTNLIAWLFTGKTISEVGSYRWMYLVLTIGFIVFLGIMVFVRQIITFAEEEEWDGPRRK